MFIYPFNCSNAGFEQDLNREAGKVTTIIAGNQGKYVIPNYVKKIKNLTFLVLIVKRPWISGF